MGDKRYTHVFPPNLRGSPTPKVTADAYELPKSERYCTCCQRPLVRKFAYLELDQRIDAYHDFGGVHPNQSQGWFPFGLTCAKKLNATAARILKAEAA